MANHIPKFYPGQTVTFTAEGAITGGQVVECGTAPRSVKVAGAASVKAIGTAAFDAIAGDKVTVHIGGLVDTAPAAAAISVGAKVEAAASGKIQTATTGLVLGIALTSASAADDIVQFVRL